MVTFVTFICASTSFVFFIKSLDAQTLVHFRISFSLFRFLQFYFPSFFFYIQYLVVVMFMVKPVCYAALVIFSVVSARFVTACPNITTSSACKWHCLVLFITVPPGLVITFLIIFSKSRWIKSGYCISLPQSYNCLKMRWHLSLECHLVGVLAHCCLEQSKQLLICVIWSLLILFYACLWHM